MRAMMMVMMLALLTAQTTTAAAQSLVIGGQQSNYGTVRLRGGFTPDPHRVQVVSGGGIDASSVDPGCNGTVSAQPDVIVRIRNPRSFLRFFVESSSDTTLVINGPNGRWFCNDDAVGTNPMVDFSNPVAGQYDVWIGSYDSGTNAQASLGVTELSHIQPGTQGQPPRPPPHLHPQPQPIPQPVPQPIPPNGVPNPFAPPPAAYGYQFQGHIEQMPVNFNAPHIDALYQQCVQFVSGARLSQIDDIVVFGRAAHNGPGYWSTNATCAIVALNARPRAPVQTQVNGSIEELPYQVAGDPATVRRIITTYVPMAVADNSSVDDVIVNGQHYHNDPSYWSATEIVNMIVSQVPW